MQWYQGNSAARVLASKSEDATLEFVQEAQTHGIYLYNFGRFNITDASFGPHKSYFGDSAGAMLVEPGQYLVLLGDGQWIKAEQLVFMSLFKPVGNSDTMPEDKPVQEEKLKGKRFYLDAGHGGHDPGAVNNNFGLQEKIAALDICLLLGESLEKQGADVMYSRTGDTYPSITARANAANNWGADAFISIHLNSAENTSASGIETLCYALNSNAGKIAEAVQTQLIKATGWKNRGVKSRPDLGVLRLTRMSAILCEVGFISNDQEAQELFKPEVQKRIADAICSGVVEIMGN